MENLSPFWLDFATSLSQSYDIGSQVRQLNSLLAWQAYLDGYDMTNTDRAIADILEKQPVWEKMINHKNRPPYVYRWFHQIRSVVSNSYLQNKRIDRRVLEAAYERNHDVMREMVDSADLELREDMHIGKQAVHIAAKQGDIEMVQILLDAGIPIDAVDLDDQSILFYAAHGKQIPIMQYLIDRGANLEHKECQGRTLLYWTSHSGDLDILDLLLRLGADPNQTSRLGRTSLSKSAWNNKVDVIRKLLAYPSTKIDMEDDRGRTALHNAVWGATGGRTGFKQGISGLTDSPGCASALLEHGADIEHADNTGATPLFIAVTTLSPNSVRVLLDFGANVTAISHRGFMPLHEGCIRGHVETVKILIEHGVDINIESPAGYKPLHCAILSETTEILTYLLTFPDIEIDESHIEQALYSVDRLKIILEKYTTTLSQ